MADNVNLDNFEGIKVDIDYESFLNSIATQCGDDITLNAMGKNWGDYARNWYVQTKNSRKNGKEFIVRNKDTYRLTHLLENGHLIVNKKGGIGWSAPRPHIRPAYNKAIQDIDKFIAQIKLNIKL